MLRKERDRGEKRGEGGGGGGVEGEEEREEIGGRLTSRRFEV